MNWFEIYSLIEECYKDNNEKLIIDKTNENEIKKELRIFISDLKKKYKCNQLNDEEIKFLQKLNKLKGINKNNELSNKRLWNSYYTLAKKYYKKHGNLLIPQNYTVNNMKLGLWLSDQRCSKSLDKEKINLLDSINMQWSKNHIWNKHYNALKKYKEMYGTILMSNDFVFNYNNKSYELGQFLDVQRKVLEKDRIEYIVLDNLGMIWKDIDFVSLKEYIEKEYNDYLNNMIDTDRKDKLVKFGVFKYSDYDVVKNDYKELTKSIKTKK